MNKLFNIVFIIISALTTYAMFLYNCYCAMALILIEIISIIIMFINKNKQLVKKSDWLFIYLYLGFVLLLCIYVAVMMKYTIPTLNIIYVSKLIFVPWIICLIYYDAFFLIKTKNKSSHK